MSDLLLYIIFSPAIMGLFVVLFGGDENPTRAVYTKSAALAFAVIHVIATLYLWNDFTLLEALSKYGTYYFETKYQWLQGYNIFFHVGVDGISLAFIALSSVLIMACMIAIWNTQVKQLTAFLAMFLVLETVIIGAFAAVDLLLFYVFFESVLIPMFLIIGIWGDKDRVYASYKFFLYTLAGSILLLIGVVYVYLLKDTTNISELMEILPQESATVQKCLWLAFFASFAIKIPMWPFHTWLPNAHVQAPTAGSVILAGILLKMGGYGFIRFSLPMFPAASEYFSSFVFVLSCIAIIYASLMAFAQTNMKKLVAYSSIAHMGYVTIGIFSRNFEGVSGAVMQMISHGLISAGLFLLVGVLSDRTHTKEIKDYGGFASKMPNFAILFMLFALGSVGLPGTSAFVAEFLSLLGIYKVNKIYAAIAATGVILGAVYMLVFYKNVMFGKLNAAKARGIQDINISEFTALIVLIFLVILIGIYPSVITNVIKSDVTSLTSIYR